MIAHLRGRVLRKSPQEVIVDVAGVGYRLAIPVSTFYRLGEEGTEARGGSRRRPELSRAAD